MDTKSTKQVIVIRRDLKMRRGKEIAQGSHASCAFLAQSIEGANLRDVEWEWLRTSYRKIVCQVDTLQELEALLEQANSLGVSCWPIIDQGLTEFDGPTLTCAAFGPDTDERLAFTQHLKLY